MCYLSIDDDPQGIFESTPPSPSDMLVIFRNLKQMGHKSLALAVPLAWEAPDHIALAAVDAELGRFEHVIVGVPLQNGITNQPLPPAFVRASLPLSVLRGPAGPLPIVNGLAVPNAVTGSEKSLGAFSILASEARPAADSHGMLAVPLVARWDDRIVLSLPLAVAMARLGVGLDSLVIVPGKHIILGEHGPVVPVDIHGQAVFPVTTGDSLSTPADEVIRDDPKAPLPAGLQPGPGPLVVRDERSGHEAEAKWMGDAINGILHAPYANGAKKLARLPVAGETAWLAWCAALCGLAVWWKRPIAWRLVMVASGSAIPYACVIRAGFWTAPLALVLTFFCAAACMFALRKTPILLPATASLPCSESSPASQKQAKPKHKSGTPGKKPHRKKKRS